MNNEEFKTTQVAKILGISKGSVPLWANVHLSKVSKNNFGHNIFSQDDIKHLKKVKELLKKGYMHDKIKDILSKESETEIKEPIQEAKDPVNSVNVQSESSTLDLILDNVDFRSSFTNDAFKQVLKRCIYLEEENKRLLAK